MFGARLNELLARQTLTRGNCGEIFAAIDAGKLQYRPPRSTGQLIRREVEDLAKAQGMVHLAVSNDLIDLMREEDVA